MVIPSVRRYPCDFMGLNAGACLEILEASVCLLQQAWRSPDAIPNGAVAMRIILLAIDKTVPLGL
jgi:hypothetical protein